MKDKKIGWAFCGSFCSIKSIFPVIEKIAKDNEIIPVVSYAVLNTDTRFGSSEEITNEIKKITKGDLIASIADAEPIGPKINPDIMVIAPCTGNTLAKLCGGITDTPVLMAAKAHLRNNKPLVIALYTNDGLSANAQNIGVLLNRKNIYFVPFYQDDIEKKPFSINAKTELIEKTIENALKGEQIKPII